MWRGSNWTNVATSSFRLTESQISDLGSYWTKASTTLDYWFDNTTGITGNTNIVTLGTIGTGVWQGTAVDFSSYTNATADTGIKFTSDAIGFDCSEVEGTDIDCSTEAITLEAQLDTPTSIPNLVTVGTIGTGVWQGSVIDHERGGLEADVSSYAGIVSITGGSTAQVDSIAEINALLPGESLASTTANLSVFTNDSGFITAAEVYAEVYGTSTLQNYLLTSSIYNEINSTTTQPNLTKTGEVKPICFSISSSTPIIGTSTWLVGAAPYALTCATQWCDLDTGTSLMVEATDGTNTATPMNCTTTPATASMSSNNTFTQYEQIKVSAGNVSGSVLDLNWCMYCTQN